MPISAPPAPVPHPGYISGRWYPAVKTVASNPTVVAANTIGMIPFILPQPITIQALGANLRTALAGNCQFAIYAHDLAAHRPTGAPLGSTGNVDTSVAGPVSANVGANVTLQANTLYWMAINANVATSFVTCNGGDTQVPWLLGSATLATITTAGSVAALCYTYAQTFGTWPDLTSVAPTETSAYGNAALLFLKAA